MWTQKLRQIVDDLSSEATSDGAGVPKPRVSDLWKTAGTTLQRTGVDRMRSARVIAMRDLEGLRGILAELDANPQLGVQTRYVPSRPAAPAESPVAAAVVTGVATGVAGGALGGATDSLAGGATAVAETPAPHGTSGTPLAAPSDADLVSAMKAFRKRLKVTQLDEESKLGPRIVGGKRASVVAITPPSQFPRAIWDALVTQGKLKRSGGGMFELAEH